MVVECATTPDAARIGTCQFSPRRVYIAMEFVEGGNLRKILKIRKRLRRDEALQITKDAASGLAYAFARGVTHRDIKPSNLLISTTTQTKLVDFGLAQLSAGENDGDKADRTVDYNDLERATNVKRGDVRSDIYFPGCVLLEMLSGRSPPAKTADRMHRMRRNRFEDVVPLRRADAGAPRPV